MRKMSQLINVTKFPVGEARRRRVDKMQAKLYATVDASNELSGGQPPRHSSRLYP